MIYAVLAVSLLLLPAGALAAIVENCASAPVQVVNKTTTIDLPGEDVTLRCALSPLDGSKRIAIRARSITIDGGAGGAIRANGKGNAIALTASETVHIDRASLDAENRNGNARITGAAGIVVTATSAFKAGDALAFTCTDPACAITLHGIDAEANRITIFADGTITIGPRSVLVTLPPIDAIRIVSAHGDVLAGGGVPGALAVGARNDETPAVRTGFARAVLLAAAAFCDAECDRTPPNQMTTSLEGMLEILAPEGSVDLTASGIHVGETIDLAAATEILLTQASVQNCGPKRGKFRVAAANCTIEAATLLDDDPDPAPQLTCTTTGSPTALGTCSARRQRRR